MSDSTTKVILYRRGDVIFVEHITPDTAYQWHFDPALYNKPEDLNAGLLRLILRLLEGLRP